MVYDAFVYYTHYDLPLGDRVCQLLEENGLKCWNDKRDTHGFNRVTEVLALSKSFIIIGNNDGGSTYRFHLLREMLQIRSQQPLFLICAKGTEDLLFNGKYFPDTYYGINTVPQYFKYEDRACQSKAEKSFRFSDFDSFEKILIEESQMSANKFDAIRFKQYIDSVITKEISSVVLSEPPRVFISHSHLDNKEADMVYQKLTNDGVRCWIDTKDIPAGASYPDTIVKGLEWCNCLVLIYSKNVLNSIDIPNELEVAHTDHKIIIPFLIDDSKIEKGYRYYLPRKQWIYAGPQSHVSIELSIEKLKSELFRNMPQMNCKSNCSVKKTDEGSISIINKIRCYLTKMRGR